MFWSYKHSIWHRRRDSNWIYQSRTSQPNAYQIFCQLLYAQRTGIFHQLWDALFRICDIFLNGFVEYLFVHLIAIAQAIANQAVLIIDTDGMTVHGSGCQTQFQYGRLHVIRFYEGIVNLKSGFAGIFADCQVPVAWSAIAITVIAQRCVHAEYGIREQANHGYHFTEIVRVDPLIIASADFFHIAVCDQLFALRIEYLFLCKLRGRIMPPYLSNILL